jgi:hypothetical protein
LAKHKPLKTQSFALHMRVKKLCRWKIFREKISPTQESMYGIVIFLAKKKETRWVHTVLASKVVATAHHCVSTPPSLLPQLAFPLRFG